MLRLKIPRRRSQSWEAHRKERAPAGAVEVFEMRGQSEGLVAPIPEPEQRPDADAPESRGVTALGTIQSPVEILLRPKNMHLCIGRTVISLLVNHEPLRARLDKRAVFIGFHRGDLNRNRRNKPPQPLDAAPEISAGNEFRMFSRHEEDISEALGHQMSGLSLHLIDLQRHTLDGIFTGKTAVGTGIDALVRQIERCKKPHRPPKVLTCESRRFRRQGLQVGVRHRREQVLERPQ